MFVRELAMHLKCLPNFIGTRYVDDFLPNIVYTALWIPGITLYNICMAILCMYLTLGNTFGLCGDIWTINFFSCLMCGFLEQIGKKKETHQHRC